MYLDTDDDLNDSPASKSTQHAFLAAGRRYQPTEADWTKLAENLPLLRTMLQGLSLGKSGDRRSRRQSLVGSILNRRPTWDAQVIAERFRPSLEAYDGKKKSNPAQVDLLIQEILQWCDEFERGAGKAFSRDELRLASRAANRQGLSDTKDALEALLDMEPGRTPLLPITPALGRECGKFLASKFPKRELRAMYDTLTVHIGDLHHTFSRAAIEGWEHQRKARPSLITLATSDKGIPRSSEANAIAALFELGYPLGFDERKQCIVVQGPLPWDPATADRPLQDADHGMLTLHVAQRYLLHATGQQWASALNTYAYQNAFDSVYDYLVRLDPWDGKHRWPTILTDIMGMPAGDLQRIHHVCMVRWAIGAIARAMRPGCKNDTMIVLVGEQGLGKTSFGKALVQDPSWFLESYNPKAHDKDSAMIMHSGAWFIEHGELAGMRAAQVEEIKAFLSTTHDTFRRPYGRSTVKLPRRAAAIGTANDRGSGLFRDPTGSRRFWPVPVSKAIDVEAVHAVRDQLWAEALQYYRDDIKWWLTEEESRELIVVSEPYQLHDVVGSDVLSYLDSRWSKQPPGATELFVTTKEVLAATGHLKPYKRADQMRVAEHLKTLGGKHALQGKAREHGYKFYR